MTDLEITRKCAEAMGLDWRLPTSPKVLAHPHSALQYADDSSGEIYWRIYDPLNNDAQAMALVKKFELCLNCATPGAILEWEAWYGDIDANQLSVANSPALNQAICECISKLPTIPPPKCKKCGKPCQKYGGIGGYSVQCISCNQLASKKRRERSARRKA